MSRGSCRATMSASSSVLGFIGRLLFPRPFGVREAVDPRISSESYPSAMGMLHALLRRTGRWRQSAPGRCSASLGHGIEPALPTPQVVGRRVFRSTDAVWHNRQTLDRDSESEWPRLVLGQ